MTRDDSRPYGRDNRMHSKLAPSRIENRRDATRRREVPPTPDPDPAINLSDVIEGHVHEEDSRGWYDPSDAAAREQAKIQRGEPYGNGNGHYTYGDNTYSTGTGGSRPAQPVDDSGYDVNPYMGAPAGELSRQDQYLLLMHTIQLYDDDWRLANIRTSSKKNWLVAFLIPRNKAIDLQQALKKQIVLRITVDSRGNTDVAMPKRRGLLGRLLNWLRGS